jgi:hypothetical protein
VHVQLTPLTPAGKASSTTAAATASRAGQTT